MQQKRSLAMKYGFWKRKIPVFLLAGTFLYPVNDYLFSTRMMRQYIQNLMTAIAGNAKTVRIITPVITKIAMIPLLPGYGYILVSGNLVFLH